MLDNFPFAHAIEAITRKPAASEVKRWLVYIEPDPSRASSEPAGAALAETAPPRQPGWLDTILAGLSSIPRKEPIVDDLARVRDFNERVAYIADLTQTNYPQIETALHETDQDLRAGELSQANIGQVMSAMNQRARQRLGSGYVSYIRLKLQGIANDVADIVARAYAYPADSGRPASCARSCWPKSPTGSLPGGRRRPRRSSGSCAPSISRSPTAACASSSRASTTPTGRTTPARTARPDRRQLLDMVKAELYARIEGCGRLSPGIGPGGRGPGAVWAVR